MLHTYLICSMEPDQYEYENEQREDYAQDEWYYQNPLSNPKEDYQLKDSEQEWRDFDDMNEGFDMQEEPDWFFGEREDGYYEPENEI